MIQSVQGLNDQVFELVGGDDSFCCTGKTLNDGGEDGGFNGASGG